MRRRIKLRQGDTFGRLVVARGVYVGSVFKWECLCVCGEKTRATASELRRGHTRSCGCLHKDVVVARNKTQKNRDKVCKALSQDKSPGWLGEKAGYFAKHNWIRKYYGCATRCVRCKTKSKKARFEWANLSGKYYRRRDDFIELCVFCHRSMDLGVPVDQYTLDGHFVRSFSSSSEAARSVGVTKCSILNVVSGRKKTCMGFLWKKRLVERDLKK